MHWAAACETNQRTDGNGRRYAGQDKRDRGRRETELVPAHGLLEFVPPAQDVSNCLPELLRANASVWQGRRGYLERGCAEGARPIVGGRRSGDRGYFVEPTVLVDTRPGMAVMDEEIFGPVVCAVPFTDPEEVVREANNSIYGLAAAVWTRDVTKAHRIASALRAGTVWVNCYNIFDAAMPFGGYKQSGWGRELGAEVFELYTETKAVCLQL